MTKELRPSPLGGIKRRAKAIKARQGIIHTQALEVAARQADFQGFKQARRGLGSATPSLNGDFPERPGGTNLRQDKFLKQCGKAWVQTLKLLNPDRKDRLIWSKRPP